MFQSYGGSEGRSTLNHGGFPEASPPATRDDRTMERVVYSKRLVGSTSEAGAGMLRRAEAELPDGARLESEMVFAHESAFREHGRIVFGPGSELHFRTLGIGRLTPSPDPGLSHGTVTLELDGGTGPFERSVGRITSNFILTADGEITDDQHGLIFFGD
jgi:hypothetical protein